MPSQSHQRAADPLRVLMLLTNAYDPDPRVRQEALGLVRAGCRVQILAWDRDLKSAASECLEGVQVERIFVSSGHGRGTIQLFFYALLYWTMLWRGLRTAFDVVHCHDLDTLPLGFLLGKLKGKPIVYDAHESFVDMVRGSVHPLVCRILFALENFFLRRVALLITVGEKLRRYFADRGAKRSVVVGNWKDLNEYQCGIEEIQAIRARLGVPANAVIVCCITQLLKNRMIEELIEAVEPYDDVYALLAGKGELDQLVRQATIDNPRILYLGFIHASEVAGYTCASDVVYCGFAPSMPNFRFAAPNKLFEALAAGKPLISPDLGEIGDLIREGDCGIVMRDCSAAEIRRAVGCMRDPALRQRWADRARQLGKTQMNWGSGEHVLLNEYRRFGLQPRPDKQKSLEESAESTGCVWTDGIARAASVGVGTKDR